MCFLPSNKRANGFAGLIVELNHHRRIAPLPLRQFHSRQLRRPNFLRLHNFQVARLHQEFADLRKIGRIISALAHAPQIILLHEIQFVRAVFDRDMRDVIDRKIVAEQFLADFSRRRRTGKPSGDYATPRPRRR